MEWGGVIEEVNIVINSKRTRSTRRIYKFQGFVDVQLNSFIVDDKFLQSDTGLVISNLIMATRNEKKNNDFYYF